MRWVIAAALIGLFPIGSGSSEPLRYTNYGVFCVRGHLTLDERRIEELKTVHGGDVCRLDEDETEAGARAKAERLGGIGATCTCP